MDYQAAEKAAFLFTKNADICIMLRRQVSRMLCFCLVFVFMYGREYTIEKGDTLLSIARKNNIPVAFIRRLNELTSDTLKIGQKLILPDEVYEYTVQSGDSLLGITRKFSTSLSAIILCNQLPHETIYPGQKLIIPIFTNKTNAPLISASSIPSSPAENSVVHIVQQGDTLYSIARRYGVTTDDLLLWNKKTSVVLFVGEKIKIYSTKNKESISSSISVPRSSSRDDENFPIPPSLIQRLESTSRGVRIWVKETTPLRSTVSGVVEYTGWLYGFGNVVILSIGNEKRMVFGELETITVRKGQKISREDVIATVQSGRGFYLEIRDGITVLDPMKWYRLPLAQKASHNDNL